MDNQQIRTPEDFLFSQIRTPEDYLQSQIERPTIVNVQYPEQTTEGLKEK